MELEELRKQRKKLQEQKTQSNSRLENSLTNMEILANESKRVATLAHNSEFILNDLDREFELKTGLKGPDIKFLFLATGLQCLRIYVFNKLTQREKATKIKNSDGSYTLEGKIDKMEQNLLNKFDNGMECKPSLYYAPLNQIIANPKVPYDCTSGGKEGFFQHANHRFSTLGHDPVLGLFFGTANILTNTISITKLPIPGIFTKHVLYNITPGKGGSLKIGTPLIDGNDSLPCSTIEMCIRVKDRFENDKPAVVAALIKQVMHIGTDMYTKLGIQFPGSNLLLTPKQIGSITKYIDWGTAIKAGISGFFSIVINNIISILHNFMYSEKSGVTRELYNVKTKKIITYSNAIASYSNIIATGLKMYSVDKLAIKDLDIGGLITTIHNLIESPKYIKKIKEEYIFGNFGKMIEGKKLDLLEV